MLPAEPYRGIHPFRFVDHAIFFAREREVERLTSLVSVYRGTMLYGATGTGKSSLVNAGLLPCAVELGFRPERLRVQPRAGEALVVERIPTADDGSQLLPSLLAGHDSSARVVLSTVEFEQRVQAACDAGHRPLVVFDQFEELCTLFETGETGEGVEVRERIVELLVRLLRSSLPIKLLLSFREDYLGQVKGLLAACPELVDQSLQLTPLAADTLPTIVRCPFERFPGHFARELDPALAEALRVALAERFGAGDLSLSEVQTVCLRLWQSDDPDRLLAEKGVQGLLEDYLGEALDAFPSQTRFAAVALLGQMVTAAGTRNVISASDLVQRVREDDDALSPALVTHALDRLDRESRLVRHERRRDLDLYEITSEFLVPWISRRREQARRLRERQRLRRRLLARGMVVGVLLAAALAFVTLVVRLLIERETADRARGSVQALALASAASAEAATRPDVSLLLALGAYERDRRLFQSQDALTKALVALRGSGPAAIMHGHRGEVLEVAVSPGGGRVASAGLDGTVRLWSTRTHRQIGAPFRGHDGNVNDVAFSPDGRLLASGGDDGTVRIWNLAGRERSGVRMGGGEDGVLAVAFARDGRTLVSVGWSGEVRFWSVTGHRQIRTPMSTRTGSDVSDVAFGPRGLLATGYLDGTLRLWSLRTRHRIGRLRSRHRGPVYSVDVSPDGRLVASGGDDGIVWLSSVSTRRNVGRKMLGDGGDVASVAFSPDGRTLASASWDSKTWLWRVATQTALRAPFENGDADEDVVFGPHGQTLVAAGSQGSVRLWSTHGPSGFGRPLRGHVAAVDDVAISHDGTLLVSGARDDTVRIWNARTRRQIGPPLFEHSAAVTSLAFSADDRVVASGSWDGTVRLWDVAAHRPLGDPLGHGAGVTAVAFGPPGSGTVVSAARDGTVRAWSVATGAPHGEPLRLEADGESPVALSSSGTLVATRSAEPSGDGEIRVWDVATGRQQGSPLRWDEDLAALAFSPDASRLAAATLASGTVRAWDLSHVPYEKIGEPMGDRRVDVSDIAFSPDDDLLVTAADGDLVLWKVGYPTALSVPLKGSTEGALDTSVAFSRDGRTLAATSEDGSVRVWPGVLWNDFAELRAEVCHVVGGSLTRVEWKRYVPGVSYRRSCAG